MIKFSNFSLRRGVRLLFKEVNLTINAGQKVALTGANGSGKSSLFAALVDEIHADSGEIALPQKYLIASVKQETPAVNIKALDYVKQGNRQWYLLDQKIKQAEIDNNETLLVQYHAEMDSIHGYQLEVQAEQLLSGLGFSVTEQRKPLCEFSGGWRMRLNLAQALISPSDILLLDEPTNHLDLETVVWLEQWLQKYQGTLLLISHDRDFIDNICTHVMHIENESIEIYSGNFSFFEKAYHERQVLLEKQFQKQQEKIDHLSRFVEKFRAKATKAKQAQSRLKMLEKMERVSLYQKPSDFSFSFENINKMPNPLIKMEQLVIGYQDIDIISDLNLTIVPGMRLGLLGHNGAGKSTLLKTLCKQLSPLDGDLFIHQDLKTAYFAQHQIEQLNVEQTPMEFIQSLDQKASDQLVRNFLGRFGFSSSPENNKADAIIKPFSGGEKARLVLSALVYQRPNFLILDEPTNHLDMQMRDALALALQDYQGALILVSHDRYLLNSVVDEFYLIENKQLKLFDGDLNDYWSYLSQSASEASLRKSQDSNENNQNKKSLRQQNAQQRNKLQPLKKQQKQLENEIEKHEKQLEDIENQLSDNSIYQAENKKQLTDLLLKQGSIKDSLDKAEHEWFEVSSTIESEMSDNDLSNS